MKILFVVPLPPPHHGLSIINQHLKEKISEEEWAPFRIHFVNSAISARLSEISSFSPTKIGRLLMLAGNILRARWKMGLCVLYYIPATGRSSQVIRDWFLLGLFRPFFSHLVLHWHGLGLREFIEGKNPFVRKLTEFILGAADLSIVLHKSYEVEATWLKPKNIAVVFNGIPDPCPDFNSLLSFRESRFQERTQISSSAGLAPPVYSLLFLGHCTREKGLFDTLDAVALANNQLHQEGYPLRFQLKVAGNFFSEEEKSEFDQRLTQTDLKLPDSAGIASVQYLGFVEGSEKDYLFRQSDCLCFPSYFPTEAQPVSVIEALAYGLNVVVSEWRALPDCLPPETRRSIPIRNPALLAQSLLEASRTLDAGKNRKHFLEQHTVQAMLQNLSSAFSSLD